MQDGFAKLGRTVGVDATMVSLPFGTNYLPAAYGAVLRHAKGFVTTQVVLVFDHAIDFGDYIAAALDFDPIADFYAQPHDFIHVVKRGSAHCGAADGNRLEHGHGRKLAGAYL